MQRHLWVICASVLQSLLHLGLSLELLIPFHPLVRNLDLMGLLEMRIVCTCMFMFRRLPMMSLSQLFFISLVGVFKEVMHTYMVFTTQVILP